MAEQIIEINGRTVIHNGYFAYEGCHKIYVLEDNEDVTQAKETGYNILPIRQLELTYHNSCPLKFIYNWKLTEHYVRQFEQAEFNYVYSC